MSLRYLRLPLFEVIADFYETLGACSALQTLRAAGLVQLVRFFIAPCAQCWFGPWKNEIWEHAHSR